MRYLLVTFIALTFLVQADAQSFAYGLKSGLTLGTQRWDNSITRSPLFRYHVIGFVESAPEDNAAAIFGQVGYHVKGSAIRTFATTAQTSQGLREIPAQRRAFEFNNVSVVLGGKKKYDWNGGAAYYSFGIRGEYTINTNLEEYEALNEVFPIYPFDTGVRKINYGVTVGGGLEFPIGEYVGGILEFTVNPDFSKQYEQPRIDNISSPFVNGQTINIPERNIVNLTFELSVGIRLLRVVEYID